MGEVWSLIASVLAGFLMAIVAAAILVKGRVAKTRQVLERRARDDGDTIRLTLASVRYSGADFGYPKVKNNGVLIVGNKSLYFQNYLEKVPSIVLPVDKIQNVITAASFRGQPSTLTGGSYLIIHTVDNNQIGFLVKDAETVRGEIENLENRGVE